MGELQLLDPPRPFEEVADGELPEQLGPRGARRRGAVMQRAPSRSGGAQGRVAVLG